jgi:hypothetical protein
MSEKELTNKILSKPIGKRLKKPRWIQQLYANVFGYFWLPCPLCGECFGGHEWLDDCSLMINSCTGSGVCANCYEKAHEINKKKVTNETC